ncbi:MAG: HD-GYP domain-containing protein [Lachnospiraceae bacterium]
MENDKKHSNTKTIHHLEYDIEEELQHGIFVSKLAYAVGTKMGLEPSVCRELAIAGLVHDIGKLRLTQLTGVDEDFLVVEELKYIRRHPTLGYLELKDQPYSDFVLESVLYHHENYDGSGYPNNMKGPEIPLGARILRICDVYAALRSDRPYRKGFDFRTALQLMIEEVKNFDIHIFILFQRVMHEKEI